MVKTCKQCGATLTSGESNNICEKCRSMKRTMRAEVNAARKKKKKGVV